LTLPAWKLLYKNSDVQLSQFWVIEKDEWWYISLTNKTDYDYWFMKQCVGFVKAVTDLWATSTWKKWDSVTPFNLPIRGDVIATFNANWVYDYKHTAIVLSTSNTHLYVIDQNWEWKANNSVGKIIVHVLKFSWNGVNNANNYYIVEK
jgi:hypothetical protein